MKGLSRRQLLQAGAAGSGALLAGGGLTSALAQSPTLDYSFPPNFVWGAGTCGLQHEGSPLADGGGESIFYTWSHTPGNVPPGETIDVTADFYNRYESDVALMSTLGIQSAHFEPSWSRVLPQGTGTVNQAGLDFYDSLVDEILGAGIDPVCGLYVWDHPQVLQDQGGWLNRDMAEWYAEYAELMFDTLGDRVVHWVTQCEPISFTATAYFWGLFPPQETDVANGLVAIHHQMLGQGLSVQAFRASDATGEIGPWHLHAPASPATPTPADVAAAKRMDAFWNKLPLHSQMRGEYPQSLVNWYGATWPEDSIEPGDMAIISTPVDFIGVDYYFDWVVAHDPLDTDALGLNTSIVSFDENSPAGLRRSLRQLRNRYDNPPIHIVEIGHAVEDIVLPNGKVADPQRRNYLRNHMIAVHRAIGDGSDVRGSYVWSFMDGWEFEAGLQSRYGLVYVDYSNQNRIVKNSGYWYQDAIANNGFNAPALPLASVAASSTAAKPSGAVGRAGRLLRGRS